MKWQTQVITIATAVLFVLSVLYLIRKKNLKEEYSVLWLVASIVIILAAAFARQILRLFEFVNPESAGEILFFLIIIAQLGFILLFSVKLSSIKDQNKNLAQSVALLRLRLEKVEHEGPSEGARRESDSESSSAERRRRKKANERSKAAAPNHKSRA